MQSSKIFLFTVLLFSLQFCFGQEEPNAILFDEFGRITLEDVSARLDIFRAELQKSPETIGYLVIHPGSDSAKVNYRVERRYEKFIKSQASINRLSKDRLLTVRSGNESEIKFQFWKVSPGVGLAFEVLEKWSEPPLNLSKPFIFGDSFVEIFANFVPEFYADHLKNNENLRGHIVVFYNSLKEDRADAGEWMKTLTEEYKVPRERLKIFYIKASKSPNKTAGIEFWLVPKKK